MVPTEVPMNTISPLVSTAMEAGLLCVGTQQSYVCVVVSHSANVLSREIVAIWDDFPNETNPVTGAVWNLPI